MKKEERVLDLPKFVRNLELSLIFLPYKLFSPTLPEGRISIFVNSKWIKKLLPRASFNCLSTLIASLKTEY